MAPTGNQILNPEPSPDQDGGDVQFDRFDHDSGVLYLRMIGASVAL